MIDRRRKGSERAGRPEGRGAEQQGRRGQEETAGQSRGGGHNTMTDGKVSEIVDRGRGNPSRRLDRSGNQRTTTGGGGGVGEAPLLEKERKDPPKEATAKAREDPDGGRWVRRRHFVDRPGRDHVSLALEGAPLAPPPLARPPIFSSFSVADHLASRRRLPPFRFRTALAAPFLSRSEGA